MNAYWSNFADKMIEAIHNNHHALPRLATQAFREIALCGDLTHAREVAEAWMVVCSRIAMEVCDDCTDTSTE